MFFNAPVLTSLLATIAAASPVWKPYQEHDTLQESTSQDGTIQNEIKDEYKMYNGSGASWPTVSEWPSYEDLWEANLPLMRQSCSWNDWGADDSKSEIEDIDNAIRQVSNDTKVDNRFILAVMMQESKGCVRVNTTDNGVRNPGLMQSHNGDASCDGESNCSSETITEMIRDGVAGTSSGDGLEQILAKQYSSSVQPEEWTSRDYFTAARLYNSGSVDFENLSEAFTASQCYASDIANRLMGWTLAKSKCQSLSDE